MSIKNPMNDEEYLSNCEQIADLKARVIELEEAGQAVVDNWESGNLASAVNWLDGMLPEVEVPE